MLKRRLPNPGKFHICRGIVWVSNCRQNQAKRGHLEEGDLEVLHLAQGALSLSRSIHSNIFEDEPEPMEPMVGEGDRPCLGEDRFLMFRRRLVDLVESGQVRG